LRYFPADDDPVDIALEKHRAVLTYERWVEAGQWSDIEATFPDGPPECDCVVCRQLAAFSDRVVILSGTQLINTGAIEDAEMELMLRDLRATTRSRKYPAGNITSIDEFAPRGRARRY